VEPRDWIGTLGHPGPLGAGAMRWSAAQRSTSQRPRVIVASALWIPFCPRRVFPDGGVSLERQSGQHLESDRRRARAHSRGALRGTASHAYRRNRRTLCLHLHPVHFRMAGQPQWLTACLLFPVVIVLLRVASDIWFGSYYLMSPAVLLVPTAVVWAACAPTCRHLVRALIVASGISHSRSARGSAAAA
jgi:hypothetical protein